MREERLSTCVKVQTVTKKSVEKCLGGSFFFSFRVSVLGQGIRKTVTKKCGEVSWQRLCVRISSFYDKGMIIDTYQGESQVDNGDVE